MIGLSLGWRERDAVFIAVQHAGQRLAGVGTLGWEDPNGEWRAVEPADAARLTWSGETAFLQPVWTAIAPGIEVADLQFARPPVPQTVTLALVRVVPTEVRLRVVGYADWSEHPISDFADTWQFQVTLNASFFSDEGPIGLVVQDGKVRHRQASRKAAHFLIDTQGGPARIINLKGAHIGAPYAGFQGFPSIMSGGKLFSYIRSGGRGFDVFKVERRTAACVDAAGRVIFLATDTLTNGLAFSELGVVIGGLGCVDAMGFDGGSSTAMEIRVPGHERLVRGFKPVQVVVGVEARGASPGAGQTTPP